MVAVDVDVRAQAGIHQNESISGVSATEYVEKMKKMGSEEVRALSALYLTIDKDTPNSIMEIRTVAKKGKLDILAENLRT